MKKVKSNKLNLNKQTITHLGEVKGGKTHTSYTTPCNCGPTLIDDRKTKCVCPA